VNTKARSSYQEPSSGTKWRVVGDDTASFKFKINKNRKK